MRPIKESTNYRIVAELTPQAGAIFFGPVRSMHSWINAQSEAAVLVNFRVFSQSSMKYRVLLCVMNFEVRTGSGWHFPRTQQ